MAKSKKLLAVLCGLLLGALFIIAEASNPPPPKHPPTITLCVEGKASDHCATFKVYWGKK